MLLSQVLLVFLPHEANCFAVMSYILEHWNRYAWSNSNNQNNLLRMEYLILKVNELYSLFLKFSALGLLQDIRNNFLS